MISILFITDQDINPRQFSETDGWVVDGFSWETNCFIVHREVGDKRVESWAFPFSTIRSIHTKETA